MLLWLSGHIASWGLLYYLWEMQSASDMVFILMSGLILGVGIGFAQKVVLRFAYNLKMQGWMRLTTLGWLGGWLSYYIFGMVMPNYYAYPLWLYILPIFLFPALMQWILVRQHVKAAWLWVVAAIVSTITFALTFDKSGYDVTSHVLSGIVQGSVTGLSFAWLFDRVRKPIQNQTRTTDHRLRHSELDDEYYYDAEDYYDEQIQASRLIQG